MNKQIQRLGIFLVICFIAVFAKVQYTQFYDADSLNTTVGNARPAQRQLNRPRGRVFSADNALLAESIDSRQKNVTRRRVFPEKDLFAHVTGYFSSNYGSNGVELTYDRDLSGDTLVQQARGLTDLFSRKENVGNLQLTVRKDLQQIARDKLGEREGAVVALDIQTGAILAFWASPSYDPNLLSAITPKEHEVANAAWNLMNARGSGNPMLPRQYRDRYAPASTFKIVTASAGLQSGKVNATTVYKPEKFFFATPADPKIDNFIKDQECGGTIYDMVKVSCNAGFAKMAVEVGGPQMVETSKAFGWLTDVPIDLPAPVQSFIPPDLSAPGNVALSGIGQQNVAATPLQMAMVASAVANGGALMKPHVLDKVLDNDGREVRIYPPERWLQPLSPENAAIMTQAMYGPTSPGGTAVDTVSPDPGFVYGGKTGTAQVGAPEEPRAHTWFMGFGGPIGQPPRVAIATVVLNLGRENENTGGRIAGPIADAVLDEAMKHLDEKPGLPTQLTTPTTRPSASSSTSVPAGGTPSTPAGVIVPPVLVPGNDRRSR